MEEKKIRLLIADDQRMFAESMKYIIDLHASDIQIVGLAFDGQEAVRAIGEYRPDIVLMDVRMPVMDGVEAVRLVNQQYPSVKVLMLTTFADDEYVKASLRHGAVGYLLKNRPLAELINSIRAVNDGILQLDRAVSRSLIVGRKTDTPDEQVMASIKTLTHREREVLTLMVQAWDNRQIAKTLNVTEQTVRNYISTIYNKLGVTHRMDVVRMTDQILGLMNRVDQ